VGTAGDGGSQPSRTTIQGAPELWRTDLQRQDLSVPGREVVQSRVGNAAELATYVADKGKPLLTLAEWAPASPVHHPLLAPPGRKGEQATRRTA
jgi:hypothetical protein